MNEALLILQFTGTLDAQTVGSRFQFCQRSPFGREGAGHSHRAAYPQGTSARVRSCPPTSAPCGGARSGTIDGRGAPSESPRASLTARDPRQTPVTPTVPPRSPRLHPPQPQVRERQERD